MTSSNLPSSKPAKTPEIHQFLCQNQQVWSELLTFLDFAEEFTLGFIEVNFPPNVDLLIQCLTTPLNPPFLRGETITNPSPYAAKEETSQAPSPLEGEGWGEVSLNPPVGRTPLNPPDLRGETSTTPSPYEAKEETPQAPSPLEGEGWGEVNNTNPLAEIQFAILDFSDRSDLRFLRDAIVEELTTLERLPDTKLILLIKGLDRSIGISGDYPPVLQDLNFVRDAYRTTVPHPILLILPDYALTRLGKFAPDFWAWRSGVFRFKTTEQTRQFAHSQTLDTSSSGRKPESQERIDTLERLLMEYRPSPGKLGDKKQLTDDETATCSTILHQLGVAYWSHHKLSQAETYLDEALKLAQQGQDQSLQADVLTRLGRIYVNWRQFDQAIAAHETSLKLAKELGDQIREGINSCDLGNVYRILRNFSQATSFYQQSLDIWLETDNRYNQSQIYHNLGIVAQELREYNKAKAYYQKSLDIEIETDNRYSQASIYHNLGIVARKLREYDQANAYFHKALKIYIEYGDRYNQAGTYNHLGIVAQELREYDQAKAYFHKALDIWIEYGDRYEQASTYHNLGIVAQDLREYDQAKAYFHKALEIKIEYGDRYHQVSTYHHLGIVAQELREYDQAKAYFHKALNIDIEYGDRYSQASTYYQLGKLAAELREYQQARDYYHKSRDIFFEFEDEYWKDIVGRSLAQLPPGFQGNASSSNFVDEHHEDVVSTVPLPSKHEENDPLSKATQQLTQLSPDEKLTKVAQLFGTTVEGLKQAFDNQNSDT